MRNRRLASPLSGGIEWQEFDAASVVRPLWDGQGHLEEWNSEMPAGAVQAVSLQLYDPESCQWRLHWATNRDGRVGTPTVGSFRGDTGYFFATEEYGGRTILLRIIWQDCGADACQWEQAFSTDGGESWETNWTMAFARER